MHIIWEEFLKIIKEEAGSQVVETWFKTVIIEHWDAEQGVITLQTPNQFVSKWIQDHYTPILKMHLTRLLHKPISKISFVSNTKNQTQEALSHNFKTIIPASVLRIIPKNHTAISSNKLSSAAIICHKKENVIHSKKVTVHHNNINTQYTFDNFVVGASNSLAHAASWAICENLGKIYNPLFIYGGTGLGKTHLLHAIGNEALRRNPTISVKYETSENFINEFINSIRFDRSHQFRSKYEKINLLLFDDIQFLANKEQTQESFFHMFNMFYEKQKQIILSSDTFPKEIAGLQNRLKSRMEWGLVADIQMPDLETKIAILKKKADQQKAFLPDDVAYFIASRVISNIRELEGALIRVGAFASLTNQKVSIDMAKKVLINLSQAATYNKDGVILELILKIVAKNFSISINDIRSKKRTYDISLSRQIAFYFMKKLSHYSLQIIGNYIGGRDHSTVIHAINKIESQLKIDHDLARKIAILEQEITTQQ